jgi:hypothetical protein
VDKTPYLIKLLEKARGGKLWFLTRPRRFGKSLFIQMMIDYFAGRKELFKGLEIYEMGNTKYFSEFLPKTRGSKPKWVEFPIVFLDFSGISIFQTAKEFSQYYHVKLELIASHYGIKYEGKLKLQALITRLYQKFKLPVMILVDEYDNAYQRAILQNMNNKEIEGLKNVLANIFGIIKSCVSLKMIGLAYVTGISKLALDNLETTGVSSFGHEPDLNDGSSRR